MDFLQSQAIVLQVRDHGDSDKIVTLFTETCGKLTGIAKGAKRSQKRFVNKLELFSLLDLHYVESRSSTLVRLDQAELITPFPSLRAVVTRYTAASLVCELLLSSTRENDPDKALFHLLSWTLNRIDQGHPISPTLILFQIKMLGLLGFSPQFGACGVCGRQVQTPFTYRFSAVLGGLVCRECIMENEPLLPLSMETIKLLTRAQEMEHDKLDRLRFSPAAIHEALRLLRHYDNYLLQREIQSWNFLQLTG
jgi:DNA repair protein RecO (recombination protein O)